MLISLALLFFLVLNGVLRKLSSRLGRLVERCTVQVYYCTLFVRHSVTEGGVWGPRAVLRVLGSLHEGPTGGLPDAGLRLRDVCVAVDMEHSR